VARKSGGGPKGKKKNCIAEEKKVEWKTVAELCFSSVLKIRARSYPNNGKNMSENARRPKD